MAISSKATFVLVLVFSLFVAYSHAYTFYVGGNEGWVLHPSENYSDWSSKNRFQVNDTLVFKYKNGEDSVLEVNQQDFDQCNLSNPIQKMDTGDSVFKFNRSGPFFFVSGTGDRCKQGQKLAVVVLAVHSPPSPPMVSPVPSPTGSLAPSPLLSPPTNSPVSPPSVSPAPAPLLSPPTNPPLSPPSVSPAPAPSPLLSPPTNSPLSPPSVSPAPAPSPLLSPPTNSPLSPPSVSPAPAPSPLLSPPTNSPLSPPSVSPAPAPSPLLSPPTNSPLSPPSVSPAPAPAPLLSPPTGSPVSNPSTQPSASGAPTTSAPNADTPNNPPGSAAPVFRFSSVSFGVMVVILNYGFLN